MVAYEVAEAMRSIASAGGGRLTPDAVLAAAKDHRSPLHSYFTWDDAEAAHMQRLAQARALIRSVKIEYQTTERVVSTVAYVRDPEKEHHEQGYVSVVKLRTEEDNARSVIIMEFSRVTAALTRAKNIAASLGMVDEINGLINQVDALRERLEYKPESASA